MPSTLKTVDGESLGVRGMKVFFFNDFRTKTDSVGVLPLFFSAPAAF